MKENDVELIHRILDGDDTAFSDLVEKYQRQVHALAWRKIGDFHFAEEITQDTFLKAYKKLTTLKKPHRFAGWLYVIATHCCQDWLRKKQIETESLEDIDSEELEPEAYSRYVAEQEAKAITETQRQVVKKLLATLPESERTVITLHYFGEMTCEKISEFLGVSANTIKSRLRRARNRLKKEEPMIREAISNFQISPNLTENIMKEIARLKPGAPTGGKPLVPWAIAASSVVLIVLMLGIGSQYLARFQQPYSLDAQSEMTVELIDAPIVQNLEAKPSVRNRQGVHSDTNGKDDGAGEKSNQVLGDEGDYTRWNLPKGAKARLRRGSIKGISFSPDGTRIAVGRATGVWLYDAHTGAELALLTDHTSLTGDVAFSPDDKTLASGYGDISLWDIDTGKLLKSFRREESAIKALKIIDDGKTLFCESFDGSVRLWDVTTDTSKDFYPSSSRGFNGMLRHITGRTVTTAALYLNNVDNKGIFAVGYKDGKIRLEDASNGEHLKTLQGHKDHVNQLAFSPDGTLLVANTSNVPLRLWDVSTGKSLKTLTQNTKFQGILTFSKDGKTLACQTRDGEIELWDVDSKTLRITLGAKLDFKNQYDSAIHVLAFSPDSKRVVGANRKGEIWVWDVNTGGELFSFTTGHTQELGALAFSPDSSTLAIGHHRTIQLWDTHNFTHQPIHIHPNTSLMDLVFSPDNKTLTCAERFIFRYEKRDAFVKETVIGKLSLWDTRTGNKVSDMPVEWHKGNLPIPRGKWKTTFNGRQLGNVVFSPDGFRLVTALNSDNATKDNRFTIFVWEISEDPNRLSHLTLKDHTDTINALTFTPNGKMLASGSDDGTIRLWDSSTGTQLLSLSSEKTNSLAFSMDGKTLASISNFSQIQLWNISTGRQLTSLKEQNDSVTVLAFSTDSNILASGNRDGAIQLWDISTGNKLTDLKGHVYRVSALSFSPDGKVLVSGSSEGAIFIWDVPN